jgi:hypothetical protein
LTLFFGSISQKTALPAAGPYGSLGPIFVSGAAKTCLKPTFLELLATPSKKYFMAGSLLMQEQPPGTFTKIRLCRPYFFN